MWVITSTLAYEWHNRFEGLYDSENEAKRVTERLQQTCLEGAEYDYFYQIVNTLA